MEPPKATEATEQADGDDEFEAFDYKKDALILLIDAREPMHEEMENGMSYFNSCIELAIRLLKNKIIASSTARLAVVFFGTENSQNENGLDHVYEFLPLGLPSANAIKQLQSLISTPNPDFGSSTATDCLNNALWHCSIAFSSAKLTLKDFQRIWIFTNDDSGPKDPEESKRAIQQAIDHTELQRVLHLYYMKPPEREEFDLTLFYQQIFHQENAIAVDSTQDLIEASLRKQFQKRRLLQLPLRFDKTTAIGVEVYGLISSQRPSSAIPLDAKTNQVLRSETHWLCQDTAAHLTDDEIKKYWPYGGSRVYLSRDDVSQMKGFDSAACQVVSFIPRANVQDYFAVRSPYFLYPSESFIEGSTKAFASIYTAMVKRDVAAIALLTQRGGPRRVALLPQAEKLDDFGQSQPPGLVVIFLPYAEDVRSVQYEFQRKATEDQVEVAQKLVQALTIDEFPLIENPSLQKHYASIQALALDQDELELGPDTSLPDEEGFEKVRPLCEEFKTVSNLTKTRKRQETKAVRPSKSVKLKS